MAKPSKEEYEKAKVALPIIYDCKDMSMERIFRLMDELADERKRYNEYLDLIAVNNRVITAYEVYEGRGK